MNKWISVLAILYLAGLLALWAIIHVHEGLHWPITLFLFAPRWAVAGPLAILVPLTLVFRARLTLLYLAHGAIILFPIMGYQIPFRISAADAQPQTLKVMTANMGAGADRVDRLVQFVQGEGIQVLMFQECPETLSHPIFQKLGWKYQQQDNICIGSIYELGDLKVFARHGASHYNAIAAVECQMTLPGPNSPLPKVDGTPDSQTVHLVSLHLPTFRPAFELARHFDRETGTAFEDMDSKYRELAGAIHGHLNTGTNEFPTLLAGDFNVPVESDYYRDYWHAYRNAFSEAGVGFGFTKHTRYHGVRIDHVLLKSKTWQILTTEVGPNFGGDHDPVVATFAIRD